MSAAARSTRAKATLSPWWGVTAVAGAVLAGVLSVHQFWLRELSHLTGDAQWIWVTDTLEHVHPTAGLFVTSLNLVAPAPGALLKVCGDREYVVYVNGTPAACGWSRPGFALDLYDIGRLLHPGENAIAVEVRSPTPTGGLLLALDVEGVGPNVVVSGPAFASRQRFSLGPPAAGDLPVPVTWGAPPQFPWGYPTPRSRLRTLDAVVVEEVERLEVAFATALPRGGWAFVLPKPTFGYLWVEFEDDGLDYLGWSTTPESDPDRLRWEAQPIARVKGQERWLDPEPRTFGGVYVFGHYRPRAIEIWPVPEEFRPSAPGVVPGTHGLVPRTRWTTRTPPE